MDGVDILQGNIIPLDKTSVSRDIVTKTDDKGQCGVCDDNIY